MKPLLVSRSFSIVYVTNNEIYKITPSSVFCLSLTLCFIYEISLNCLWLFTNITKISQRIRIRDKSYISIMLS